MLKSPSKRLLQLGIPACLTIITCQAESLWLKSERTGKGMYADRTASHIGDILTVHVDETARFTFSATTSTSKDSSVANEVTQFLFTPAASSFGTVNGELPGTYLGGSTSHNGSGSVTNQQTLSTSFSVRVIDRLPNDVLVLEGVRQTSAGGETYFMVLTGYVRTDDVATDNTVQSSMIADARIERIAEGTLSDAQRKGWLMKINDFINPF